MRIIRILIIVNTLILFFGGCEYKQPEKAQIYPFTGQSIIVRTVNGIDTIGAVGYVHDHKGRLTIHTLAYTMRIEPADTLVYNNFGRDWSDSLDCMIYFITKPRKKIWYYKSALISWGVE